MQQMVHELLLKQVSSHPKMVVITPYEACESHWPWSVWQPSLPHLIWFTAFLWRPALVPGKPPQLGKWVEVCCGYVTYRLGEIIVFRCLFLHNFSLQTDYRHPPAYPSILPLGDSEEPELSAGVISWEPSSKAAAWFPWKQSTSGEVDRRRHVLECCGLLWRLERQLT